MEKSNVFRRFQVLSTESGWQKTSLAAAQRTATVLATVIPKVAYQGGGVMVWAGITATAKTDLVFLDRNVNGQRYIDDVLTPHVLPFLHQCQSLTRYSRTTAPDLIGLVSSTTFSKLTM